MIEQTSKHKSKIKTKTRIAPRIITYMNLLSIPVIDIERWILDNYQDNPFLEITPGDEGDSVYKRSAIKSEKKYKKNAGVSEKFIEELPFKANETLQSHLFNQLKYMVDNDEDFDIGVLLIGEINTMGYLERPLDEISADFDINVDELERVLNNTIHKLNPAGVGARNLKECYSLQLNSEERDDIKLRKIIEDYLEDVRNCEYHKLSEELGLKVDEIERYCQIIDSLSDNPGESFLSDDRRTDGIIIPDLIIENDKGNFKVYLNYERFPSISIDESYIDILKQNDLLNKDDLLNNFYKTADNLIYAMEMRAITMLQIGKLIIDYQEDFLKYGIDYLKPMTLSKASEILDISVSTMSRATSGKYIDTPAGIFPIRLFFSREVDNKSRILIFKRLRDIIENEDKSNPYSDREITEILDNESIGISRRTVNKYRKKLNIPSSHKRRIVDRDEI
jgi:RNA polymerase sigma-54 factor